MTYGEVGRLADEGFRLGARQMENTALLAVAMQYAWLMAWIDALRQVDCGIGPGAGTHARTNRLILRGVPAEEAARGLRLL